MSSITASFYAEIMPMDGIGGKTFSTASTAQSASTAFFADKRFSTKDQIINTDSDVMSFENVGTRSRGIRPWEQARFEANRRRQKDAEFFRRLKPNNNKNTVNKILPEIKTAWSEKCSFSRSDSHSTTNTVCWMPVKQKPGHHDVIREQSVVDAWDD